METVAVTGDLVAVGQGIGQGPANALAAMVAFGIVGLVLRLRRYKELAAFARSPSTAP